MPNVEATSGISTENIIGIISGLAIASLLFFIIRKALSKKKKSKRKRKK